MSIVIVATAFVSNLFLSINNAQQFKKCAIIQHHRILIADYMFFPKIYHLPADIMNEITATWLEPNALYKLFIAIIADKKTSPTEALFALLRAFSKQKSEIGIKCQEMLPMALHITLPSASALLVDKKKLFPEIDEFFSESMKSEHSSPGHRLQILNFISVLESEKLLWGEDDIEIVVRTMILGDETLQENLINFVIYVCFFYFQNGENIFINQVCTILNSDPKNVAHYDNALKAVNLILPFMNKKYKKNHIQMLETFFRLSHGNFNLKLLQASMHLAPEMLNKHFETIFNQLNHSFLTQDYKMVLAYIHALSTHQLFGDKFPTSQFLSEILRVIHHTPLKWNFEILQIIKKLIPLIKNMIDIYMLVKNIILFINHIHNNISNTSYFKIQGLLFDITFQLVLLFSEKNHITLFQAIGTLTVAAFDEIEFGRNMACKLMSMTLSDRDEIENLNQYKSKAFVLKQAMTDIHNPCLDMFDAAIAAGKLLFSAMTFGLIMLTNYFREILTELHTESLEDDDALEMYILFYFQLPSLKQDALNNKVMDMLDFIDEITKSENPTHALIMLDILTESLPSMTKDFLKKNDLFEKLKNFYTKFDNADFEIPRIILKFFYKLLPLLSHEEKKDLLNHILRRHSTDLFANLAVITEIAKSLPGDYAMPMIKDALQDLKQCAALTPDQQNFHKQYNDVYVNVNTILILLCYSTDIGFYNAQNYFNEHQLFNLLNSNQLKQIYTEETEHYGSSVLTNHKIYGLLSCAKFYAIENPEQLKQVLDEVRSSNRHYLLLRLAISFSDPSFDEHYTFDAFSTMIEGCDFFGDLIRLLQSSDDKTVYETLNVIKTITSSKDSYLNKYMQGVSDILIVMLDLLFKADTPSDSRQMAADILSLLSVQGFDLNPYLADYESTANTNGWWLTLSATTGYNPATPASRLG